jgi:hypothetical protein
MALQLLPFFDRPIVEQRGIIAAVVTRGGAAGQVALHLGEAPAQGVGGHRTAPRTRASALASRAARLLDMSPLPVRPPSPKLRARVLVIKAPLDLGEALLDLAALDQPGEDVEGVGRPAAVLPVQGTAWGARLPVHSGQLALHIAEGLELDAGPPMWTARPWRGVLRIGWPGQGLGRPWAGA